jgi:hypothetical protein
MFQQMEASMSRRIYAAELRALLGGVSDMTLRNMQKRGALPAARKDPGGKMRYWLSDELEPVIRGGQAAPAQV